VRHAANVEDVRIIAAIAGALTAAGLGLMTALLAGSLTRRHEHRRWLLDKRLEVYAQFNQSVSAWEESFNRSRSYSPKDAAAAVRGVLFANAQLSLLAPPATAAKARVVLERIITATEDRVDRDEEESLEEASWMRRHFVELVQLQKADMQRRRRTLPVPA
jgi:hypothetical protein